MGTSTPKNSRLTVPKTTNGCFGWHHRLSGHEFEQVPRAGDDQGRLAYCSPWGSKELDTTEQPNWIENNQDDANQTTDDQPEDDCTISACIPPTTLSIKLPPPAYHGGGVKIGLWTNVCHCPCQLPAYEIKQIFFSTNLTCLLAFKQWAARPDAHAFW